MISETDKFTYRVTWSEEDGEFGGICAEFPSLSWLAVSPDELATQAAESGVSLNRIASSKLAR